MRLQPDDIEDIKRLLPTMGRPAVAAYIGCDPATVLYHARKLDIPRAQLPPGRPRRHAADVSATEKRCTGCEQVKPLSEFHPRRQARDGRQSDCKRCELDRKIRWRAKR